MKKNIFSDLMKRFLRNIGLSLISDSSQALGYLSAEQTIAAAEAENLSVCEYVEKVWNQKGATQQVINQIVKLGAFSIAPLNILEIGAGTGRYTEKIIGLCNLKKYESYETAKDWAEWLAKEYGVISHNCDGKSLKFTPDSSVDLLHSHGVFVYLPFLITIGYFKEIVRVMKDGGFIIFDIFSEACMDETTIEQWLQSGHLYPCFLSTHYVCKYFNSHGFSVKGKFLHPYGIGFSEYLVLQKKID